MTNTMQNMQTNFISPHNRSVKTDMSKLLSPLLPMARGNGGKTCYTQSVLFASNEVATTTRLSKAMISIANMRQVAKEHGYLTDEEIEAEIQAYRREKNRPNVSI